MLAVFKALAIAQSLPPLGGSFIGTYEPLTIDGPALLEQHERIRRNKRDGSHPLLVEFNALGQQLKLRLEPSSKRLLHRDAKVVLVGSDGLKTPISLDTSVFYSGYVNDDKIASYVSAYLDDGVLVGQFVHRNEHYFIERADKYISGAPFNNIIYRMSDAPENATDLHGDTCGEKTGQYARMREAQTRLEQLYEREAVLRENASEYHDPFSMSSAATKVGVSRRRREAYDPMKHNTCYVALVADHLFLEKEAGGNPQSAALKIISLLDGANQIYYYTAWKTGGPYNGRGTIQFAVQEVIVYTDTATSPFVLHANKIKCKVKDEGTDSAGQDCASGVLDVLSLGHPDTGNWNHVCLAHALTARDLYGGILGLAWVGGSQVGICAKSVGGSKSLNTGITTTINYGQAVSFQVQTITMAHEMGHNFGSQHDDPGETSKDGRSCAPGTSSRSVVGNYVMYYKATDGDDSNNDKFSPCSIDEISNLVKARAPSCFGSLAYERCGTKIVPAREAKLCGNGIIEDGEFCDPGKTSPENDPCCDHQTCMPKGYGVVGGYQCSDKKDGMCCKNCMRLGLGLKQTMELYSANQALPIDADHAVKLSNAYNKDLTIKLDYHNSTARVGTCSSGADSCFLPIYCIDDPIFMGACPDRNWVFNPPVTPSDALPEQERCHDYGCPGDGITTSCSSKYAQVEPCGGNGDNDNGGSVIGCYPFHRSKDTPCGSGSSFCEFTGCTGSLCSRFPVTDVLGAKPAGWEHSNNPLSQHAYKCRLQTKGKECDAACAFSTNASDCISVFDYRDTDHAKWLMNTTRVSLSDPDQKYMPDGKSCVFGSDPYGGRCDNHVCKAKKSDITATLSPEVLSRWISENWQVVLGLALGGIFLGVALKYTYNRKKPEIRGAANHFANTIRRKTGFSQSNRDRPLAADRPLTSGQREQLRVKMKKGEALKRLKRFFPTCPDKSVLLGVMKRSRNEEESVKRMLKLGFPFAVPDKVPLFDK